MKTVNNTNYYVICTKLKNYSKFYRRAAKIVKNIIVHRVNFSNEYMHVTQK